MSIIMILTMNVDVDVYAVVDLNDDIGGDDAS